MSYKQPQNDLLSNQQKQTYIQILQRKLEDSEKSVGSYLSDPSPQINNYMLQRIHTLSKFRQDKIYSMYDEQPIQHFTTIWDYYHKLYPTFKKQVKLLTEQRTKNVIKELRKDNLTIEERAVLQPYHYADDFKNGKITHLKEQSAQIKNKINQINSTLDNMTTEKEQDGNRHLFAGLYTQERKKEVEEFVKKKKQERMQRRNRLEEQRKKQEDQLQKKQKQIQENQEKMQKARRQQILRRQKEWHEERDKEKEIREHRNSQYLRIKKQIKDKPPLFQKWGQEYSQRYQFTQMQRRQKVLGQRRSVLKHIDQMGLEDHEKQYEKIKGQRDRERQQKTSLFLQEQAKSRIKHHSSYEIRKDEQEKQRQKELAKQKLQKMRDYKQIVRQKYKPKVDEDKRKQLSLLIEELELNKKRVKKTTLQNGDVVYEELNSADHRSVGMKYLQMTKEMANKAMGRKRKASQSQKPLGQHKKTVDYLQQMRKNPRPRPNKLSFIRNSNISYDEKMNKVMTQAQKLQQMARNNEMKLKFGKFKTSQQILICKEQIDQKYLDIANMKLKLIKQN